MFVYLDESGDTGFKFNKGSSLYFVVTILLTEDPIPLNSAIDDLRMQLGFRFNSEFKFYSSKEHVRTAFLQTLCRHDVLFRALVVDKRKITRPYLQKREVFYNYLLRQILEHDNDRIQNATLIVDQREKGKKNKQAVSTYLKSQLNTSANGFGKIKDIKYHESHRDNLLQAVDMVAGAINAQYAKDQPHYCRLIRSKLDDVWIFTPRMAQ